MKNITKSEENVRVLKRHLRADLHQNLINVFRLLSTKFGSILLHRTTLEEFSETLRMAISNIPGIYKF